MSDFLTIDNGAAVPLDSVPVLEFSTFRLALLHAVANDHCTVAALFPVQGQRLIALLADATTHKFLLSSSKAGESYDSLTPDCPAFHWFERELNESYHITPTGHPWLKPLRFPGVAAEEAGVTDYFTMKGTAAHEVAVGPVHAGVIEPGHFRFQCMGEDVYSLEIELGYQHRGIEKMLENGPNARTPHLIETAAGDTSAASALCYCGLLETMQGIPVPSRAVSLRTLALELERIANHIGDLGALAGDVAFLPSASYCGRIRGDFLNMTAALCGNRFGRGYIIPGGVRYDADKSFCAQLLKKVQKGEEELFNALNLMFDEPSVLDRLENTGAVTTQTASSIGLVGVAARASGLSCDCRVDFPAFTLPLPGLKAAHCTSGDVLARAQIRLQELKSSLQIVKELLESLQREASEATPVTHSPVPSTRLPANSISVAAVEAWRGMLCHVAVTGDNGHFQRYKIVDPSFHNWFGLAMALRNQPISDFPICNKSFNLSYCGHDL